MPNNSKKIMLVSIFVFSFSFLDCKTSVKVYPVDFVDRNAVFASGKKLNPLMLVVEIDENGKLSLNKIETGTIEDTALLSEKLRVIFDDREKASINDREVVINRKGNIKDEDLKELVETLAELKTSPIQVIKNNF